jgi:hypothetical protein
MRSLSLDEQNTLVPGFSVKVIEFVSTKHLLSIPRVQSFPTTKFKHSRMKEFIVRFEVFTAMKIQVEVWVVMSCSVVVGYKHFGGPCCFHLRYNS